MFAGGSLLAGWARLGPGGWRGASVAPPATRSRRRRGGRDRTGVYLRYAWNAAAEQLYGNAYNPTIGRIRSPYAFRGEVSHLQCGFESILKLITYRFALGDLTTRADVRLARPSQAQAELDLPACDVEDARIQLHGRSS